MTEDFIKRRTVVSKRAENAYHEARIPREQYPRYPRNAFPHYKTMFVHERNNNKKNTMSQTIRTIYLSKSNQSSSSISKKNDTLLQSRFESKYRSLFREREERRYQRESKYSPSNWTEPLGLHSTYVRSFRRPVKTPDEELNYATQIKEYHERKEKRLRKKYDLDDVDYEDSLRRTKRESNYENKTSFNSSRRRNEERRKSRDDKDDSTRVRRRNKNEDTDTRVRRKNRIENKEETTIEINGDEQKEINIESNQIDENIKESNEIVVDTTEEKNENDTEIIEEEVKNEKDQIEEKDSESVEIENDNNIENSQINENKNEEKLTDDNVEVKEESTPTELAVNIVESGKESSA